MTEFAAAGWSLKSSNSSIVTGDQLRKSQFARLFRWVAGVIHGLDTCHWMALFELNMELETWIAVDGHDFPNVSRFTCGGVSI